MKVEHIMGTFPHVSAQEYLHASIHVAIPLLDHVLLPPVTARTTTEVLGNILSGPHEFTKRTTSSCQTQILHNMRNDGHLTQEWLIGPSPNPYVCINGPSHLVSYLQWVKTTASHIMTRRLTQPPATLNYNDCCVTYWSFIIEV